MTVERYTNEKGEVGVLISAGYGAGWSTWAGQGEREFMLFDRGLVELALIDVARSSTSETFNWVEQYMLEQNKESYLGGWKGIYVKWMKPGTEFIVEEYDGAESLRYRDSDHWTSA